jgi:hypothetical protein
MRLSISSKERSIDGQALNQDAPFAFGRDAHEVIVDIVSGAIRYRIGKVGIAVSESSPHIVQDGCV